MKRLAGLLTAIFMFFLSVGGIFAGTLIEAVRQEEVAQVGKLLMSDDVLAGVNETDRQGMTALMWACATGNVEIAKALVGKGADVDASGTGGLSPLMLASFHGKADCARFLLDSGALIDLRDQQGVSAVMWAARSGKFELVNLLIARKATLDFVVTGEELRGCNALMLSAIDGGSMAFILLMGSFKNEGLDVDAQDASGRTALFHAAENGNLGVVEVLIKGGADLNVVNDLGQDALMVAALNGFEMTVGTLLRAGADPYRKDVLGLMAIDWARSGNHQAIVKTLASSMEGHGLIEAIRLGDRGQVDRILESSKDIDTPDDNGFTPLMWAVLVQDRYSLGKLLAKGADVNAAAGDGRTPLIMAAGLQDVAAVKVLLDNGADGHFISKNGVSARILAESFKNKDILRLLEGEDSGESEIFSEDID